MEPPRPPSVTQEETTPERTPKETLKPIEDRDVQGNTPLIRACRDGNLEEAQRLIEEGHNIELKGTTLIWSPLLFACWKGHESIVRLLIDKGAIIDPEAIQRASTEGRADIVEIGKSRRKHQRQSSRNNSSDHRLSRRMCGCCGLSLVPWSRHQRKRQDQKDGLDVGL